MSGKVFVHDKALCESEHVGAGTRIWAFAHVMRDARVGSDCNIGDHTFVESGAVIGNGVTVKNGVMIWEGVEIADGAFIGPGVLFSNDKYPRSPRMADVTEIGERYADQSLWLARTYIGKGASLGVGAVICPGVTVGDYATVAAGAVVTRDVASHRLVVGNPARDKGWVCHCGVPLIKTDDAGHECPDCGRQFGKMPDQGNAR